MKRINKHIIVPLMLIINSIPTLANSPQLFAITNCQFDSLYIVFAHHSPKDYRQYMKEGNDTRFKINLVKLDCESSCCNRLSINRVKWPKTQHCIFHVYFEEGECTDTLIKHKGAWLPATDVGVILIGDTIPYYVNSHTQKPFGYLTAQRKFYSIWGYTRKRVCILLFDRAENPTWVWIDINYTCANPNGEC